MPNTTRRVSYPTTDTLLLDEIWNEMSEDWREGDTVIAKPGYKWISKWQVGKPYVIVKFYDNNENLVGVYCDVCHPVRRIENRLEYQDLYLDVWWTPKSSEPVVLDEDELQEALERKYVSSEDAEFAKSIAQELINKISENHPELQF